ncbi:hypothetical protein LAZ67_5002563 [Cordylochernes scorpioides]|uniref:Uncharacterized protein n=1 Tax=Cordylochernes scorpioides TaxID=51811 RepID=A0ABY6KGH2_9ARAC|nr:hypothetical protein LAZ67_5002563 [Cordylochernes scorpioides]
MSNQEDSFVLLSTATIMVMNYQSKYQPCRTLIDTASQATLITRDCLKKLNLEPPRTRVVLAGIGGQILHRPNGVINLNFTSHFNQKNGRKIIRELDKLLQAGGFKLRQWTSE